MKNETIANPEDFDLSQINWEEIAHELTYRWFPKYNVTGVEYEVSKDACDNYVLQLVIKFVKVKSSLELTYVANQVNIACKKNDNDFIADDLVTKIWRKFLFKHFGKEYKKMLKAVKNNDEQYEVYYPF